MNLPVQPSVSFIVLALNEEAYIEATVKTVLEAVGCRNLTDHEIILVNDGSTDQTGEIMERLASQNNKIKVVHNPRNLGLGGAYKQGLRAAKCDYVMIVAGDDIIPASDISLILGCVGQADIVLPYLTSCKLRPLGRRIGSWGFKTLINLLFGLRITYYQGMLPRRLLLKEIAIKTDSYAFTAEIVVKLVKAGCTYVEVGIPNTPSKMGNSVALQPKRIMSVFQAVLDLVREVRRPGAIPVLKNVRPAARSEHSAQ